MGGKRGRHQEKMSGWGLSPASGIYTNKKVRSIGEVSPWSHFPDQVAMKRGETREEPSSK